MVTDEWEEYYKVLQRADKAGDCTEFIQFMLEMICNALKEISETNSTINVVTNKEKIIALLRQAQRILAELKREGKILRHGANKNGYWEVIE